MTLCLQPTVRAELHCPCRESVYALGFLVLTLSMAGFVYERCHIEKWWKFCGAYRSPMSSPPGAKMTQTLISMRVRLLLLCRRSVQFIETRQLHARGYLHVHRRQEDASRETAFLRRLLCRKLTWPGCHLNYNLHRLTRPRSSTH